MNQTYKTGYKRRQMAEVLENIQREILTNLFNGVRTTYKTYKKLLPDEVVNCLEYSNVEVAYKKSNISIYQGNKLQVLVNYCYIFTYKGDLKNE